MQEGGRQEGGRQEGGRQEGGREAGGRINSFSWYVLVSFPVQVVGEKWSGNETSVYVCVRLPESSLGSLPMVQLLTLLTAEQDQIWDVPTHLQQKA